MATRTRGASSAAESCQRAHERPLDEGPSSLCANASRAWLVLCGRLALPRSAAMVRSRRPQPGLSCASGGLAMALLALIIPRHAEQRNTGEARSWPWTPRLSRLLRAAAAPPPRWTPRPPALRHLR
jgi:hypothetical protein